MSRLSTISSVWRIYDGKNLASFMHLKKKESRAVAQWVSRDREPLQGFVPVIDLPFAIKQCAVWRRGRNALSQLPVHLTFDAGGQLRPFVRASRLLPFDRFVGRLFCAGLNDACGRPGAAAQRSSSELQLRARRVFRLLGQRLSRIRERQVGADDDQGVHTQACQRCRRVVDRRRCVEWPLP